MVKLKIAQEHVPTIVTEGNKIYEHPNIQFWQAKIFVMSGAVSRNNRLLQIEALVAFILSSDLSSCMFIQSSPIIMTVVIIVDGLTLSPRHFRHG